MALSRTHNQVSDVAASLLNVLSCASSLGLRARGGRTLLQTDESKNKPPTTIVTNVCPSHSRFQPISADIERSGKPSKDARFRALKAVARVRIPSGLQGEAPSQARFRGLSQVNHLFPGTHRPAPRPSRRPSRWPPRPADRRTGGRTGRASSSRTCGRASAARP